LLYEKNDFTYVTLGGTAVVVTGAGFAKVTIGPVDLFGSAGVPPDEHIVMVRLKFIKNAGVPGEWQNWNLWLELLPSIT
jgi:hypothetical protein